MNRRFDTIIFDWDGTLVNTIDWIVHCLQDAALQCQQPKPAAHFARTTIGLSLENAMLTLFPAAETELIADLVAGYRRTYGTFQIGQEHFFPGVHAMLMTLKQSGYRLAVATGKVRFELEKALVATDTKHLFDITRCADETASKPAPRMLLEILDYTQTTSERALMVGDTSHDLQMAAAIGMPAVAVSCGAHSAEVLQQFKPLHCLNQPAELLDIIHRG